MANSTFKSKAILGISIIALLLASCNNEQSAEVKEDIITTPKNYSTIGDSLSTISQQTLLQNVAREMKAGGPVHTIEFCNLNASKLMDSLSQEYNVEISRVTSKPRNSKNMASDFELGLLEALESSGLKDTLVTKDDHVSYYKPIKLGMPACLKCHGEPGTDINEGTLNALRERYPNDIAWSYKMGDFRGAWKIQFKD